MQYTLLSTALILGTTTLALGLPTQEGFPARARSIGDSSHPRGDMHFSNPEGGPGKQGDIHGPGRYPASKKPGEDSIGHPGHPGKSSHDQDGGSLTNKGLQGPRGEGTPGGRARHGNPGGHGKTGNKHGPGHPGDEGNAGDGRSGGRAGQGSPREEPGKQQN